MTETENVLLTSVNGRVGHIALNRPKALNALNLAMVRGMQEALDRWEKDDSVESVVVTGADERAFCAGGDVKSVYFDGKQGNVGHDGALTADFFREEYTLNYRIANYAKPYIAYMDGVTMGGGVGISILGSHRIASDHTRFAMPETGIGLFPDVGGSYFMSRLGTLGLLLALTGQPVGADVVCAAGFATHYLPREAAHELVATIGERGVEPTLQQLCEPAPRSDEFQSLSELAERCFQEQSLIDVFRVLERVSTADDSQAALATKTLETLKAKSPTSMAITFEQLRRGKNMSLRDCLIMEYRMSQACMQGHDFYEGIRAVLVDKDHSPHWSPSELDGVTQELVDQHFESLGERDLVLSEQH